jgi:hypothetical protein
MQDTTGGSAFGTDSIPFLRAVCLFSFSIPEGSQHKDRAGDR